MGERAQNSMLPKTRKRQRSDLVFKQNKAWCAGLRSHLLDCRNEVNDPAGGSSQNDDTELAASALIGMQSGLLPTMSKVNHTSTPCSSMTFDAHLAPDAAVADSCCAV